MKSGHMRSVTRYDTNAKSIYFCDNIKYYHKSNLIWHLKHEISDNVVCTTSKGSDQLAHMRNLIRAFASRLNILWLLSY